MPIDTIAAYTAASRKLPDSLFDGGVVQEQFDTVGVSARLWYNPKPKGPYEPRITYWRSHGRRDGDVARELGASQPALVPPVGVSEASFPYGMLKVEFSVPKLIGLSPVVNPNQDDVKNAIDQVSVFVRGLFGDDVQHFSGWTVQRVDYAWMWDVEPHLKAYMSVLHKLRVAGMSRHPFEATSGVVWKAKNRWVKFYNKSLEAGVEGEVLRFEVSNYKDAVKYIANGWFGCGRTVAAMVELPVAVFVMAYQWEKLGLGRSDHYGHEELLVHRLREQYSSSVAAAYYALMLIREYGADAIRSELISRNNYYHWRRALLDDGFLTEIGRSYVVHDVYLPALHLPTSELFAAIEANYLGPSPAVGGVSDSKKIWEFLRLAIGLKSGRLNRYLCDRWVEYAAQ